MTKNNNGNNYSTWMICLQTQRNKTHHSYFIIYGTFVKESKELYRIQPFWILTCRAGWMVAGWMMAGWQIFHILFCMWCNVSVEIFFRRVCLITLATLKRSFSFMHCLNVAVQTSLQYINTTCTFNCRWYIKQSHYTYPFHHFAHFPTSLFEYVLNLSVCMPL